MLAEVVLAVAVAVLAAWPAAAGIPVDVGVRPVVITPDPEPIPASLLWRS